MDITLFVFTHLVQAEPVSGRNSRHSLDGATPPSLQTSMRWVSPSATPTTRIAGPTTDIAIHSSFGLNSGTRTGSGSAAAWDAESDQDSPVDPRKVGDLCFRYSCKNWYLICGNLLCWISYPRLLTCRVLSYSCHTMSIPFPYHVLTMACLSVR